MNKSQPKSCKGQRVYRSAAELIASMQPTIQLNTSPNPNTTNIINILDVPDMPDVPDVIYIGDSEPDRISVQDTEPIIDVTIEDTNINVNDTLENYAKDNNLKIIQRHVGHIVANNNKYNGKTFNDYYLVQEQTNPETKILGDGIIITSEQQYYIFIIGSVNSRVGLFSECDLDKFIMVDTNGYRRAWKYSKTGYVDIAINSTRIYIHRHILNLTNSNKKDNTPDHINQNKLDNRRCNLMIRTQSDQNRNQKIRTRKERHAREIECNLPIEKFITYTKPYTDSSGGKKDECFSIEFADPTGAVKPNGGLKKIRGKTTAVKDKTLYYKYICALKIRYDKVYNNPRAILSFADVGVFTINAFADYTKKLIKQVADMDPQIPQGSELFDLYNLTFPNRPVTSQIQETTEISKAQISNDKKKARMERGKEARRGICQFCEKDIANKKRHESICKQNPDTTEYHEELAKKKPISDENRRLALIANSKRLLTDIQIMEIIELKRINNTPVTTLAELYKVPHQTISKVLNGSLKPKCELLKKTSK